MSHSDVNVTHSVSHTFYCCHCEKRSDEAIHSAGCHALVSRAANEHVFVITSLAPPGVVIQLDGHGAERLAMTFSGFIAAITQAAALAAGSRNDKSLNNRDVRIITGRPELRWIRAPSRHSRGILDFQFGFPPGRALRNLPGLTFIRVCPHRPRFPTPSSRLFALSHSCRPPACRYRPLGIFRIRPQAPARGGVH